MNQVLEVIYNNTTRELVLSILMLLSLPLVFLVLKVIFPKRYDINTVLMSLVVPLSGILFLAIQIVIQILTKTKFSFDYQFIFTLLFLNISILFLISLSLKNVLSFLVVAFTFIIMYIPLIYTGFISLNAVVVFIVPLMLSVLILCLPLKKYYAKL